jgi:MarR family transcriptional regulator, organic hydroperoxide resistance regulator
MTSPDELTEIIRQWMDVFATRSMHDWSHYVKTTGLSMPQFGILMHLHYREHCGVSHISERMEISAAAASQLVDRLVQSGLVERIEDPNDRRAKQLTLSSKGQALIETGIVERSRWVGELVTSMTPDEYEVVAAALSTLTHAARRLEQSKVTG